MKNPLILCCNKEFLMYKKNVFQNTYHLPDKTRAHVHTHFMIQVSSYCSIYLSIKTFLSLTFRSLHQTFSLILNILQKKIDQKYQ